MDVIQGNAPAPPPEIGPAGGERIATIMHLAIFEAVNTIDPHYQPYYGKTLPRSMRHKKLQRPRPLQLC
jgi:hypothetical protein